SLSDPPALRVGDVTIEATGPDGAEATYTVKAFDPSAGTPLAATCDTPAGTAGVGQFHVTAQFPLGATTVTCETTTLDSTTVTKSATVTIQDTTPPDVTVPADVTVTTTDPSGTAVSYPDATPSCAPPSGSTFPVGMTTVTCTATDAHGNSSTGTFHVEVDLVDTTAPVLTVPNDFTVATSNPAGTTVNYSASAVDNLDGALVP